MSVEVFNTGAALSAISSNTGATGGGASTGTLTQVAQNIASVQLIAANANRKEIWISNNAAGDDTLWIVLGSVDAVVDQCVPVSKGGTMVLTFQGEIRGIWSSAGGGRASVQELT